MTFLVCIPTEQVASPFQLAEELKAETEVSSMHCPHGPVCQWYTVQECSLQLRVSWRALLFGHCAPPATRKEGKTSFTGSRYHFYLKKNHVPQTHFEIFLVICYQFDYMKEMLFPFPPLHMPNSDFDKFWSTSHIEQIIHGQYVNLYQKDNKIIITAITLMCLDWSTAWLFQDSLEETARDHTRMQEGCRQKKWIIILIIHV